MVRHIMFRIHIINNNNSNTVANALVPSGPAARCATPTPGWSWTTWRWPGPPRPARPTSPPCCTPRSTWTRSRPAPRRAAGTRAVPLEYPMVLLVPLDVTTAAAAAVVCSGDTKLVKTDFTYCAPRAGDDFQESFKIDAFISLGKFRNVIKEFGVLFSIIMLSCYQLNV